MYNFVKKYQHYAAVGIVVAMFWSWILYMNVAMVSKNTLLATCLAWSIFAVIVFINTIIYTRVLKYIISAKSTSWGSFTKIILIWAFTEWFTGWVLAFVWFGRGASLDTVFPFASFTPLLMYTPLEFLTRFVGYHGLSALFVGLIIVTVLPNFKKLRFPVYALCLIITLFGWVLYKEPNGIKIQTTIVAEYLNQTQKLQAAKSDVVVLPEYGLDDITNASLSSRFDGALPRSFVGSQQKIVDSGQVRNIFIFGNQDGFLKELDKSRLIAGGEYLPYTIEGILRATNNTKEIDNFNKARGVIKGPDKLSAYNVSNDIIVGGAVCSSIISTEDYRQLTRQGSTVLTNSASLGIFTGSQFFNIQHGGFAKFMAVANARPFLQSSNYGPAFAVDHNGRELKRITPINSAEVSVTTNKKTTPYSLLGEWPVFIGGIIVFGIMFQKVRTLQLKAILKKSTKKKP